VVDVIGEEVGGHEGEGRSESFTAEGEGVDDRVKEVRGRVMEAKVGDSGLDSLGDVVVVYHGGQR
jgi:hypothetical protein